VCGKHETELSGIVVIRGMLDTCYAFQIVQDVVVNNLSACTKGIWHNHLANNSSSVLALGSRTKRFNYRWSYSIGILSVRNEFSDMIVQKCLSRRPTLTGSHCRT
jgi:hypothetical protein